MKINLLLFGIAKDIIGGSNSEIELPAEATVASLQEQLLIKYPEMEKLKSLMIAVNQQYVAPDHQIAENDEVAIIPPVSGG